MNFGGSRAPPAPDYTPVANASREAAEVAAAVQREQLEWAREQYRMDRGLVDRVVGMFIPQMERENAAAAADRERYQRAFQPLEDRFIQQAINFDTPERQEQEAGRAAAEVQSAQEAQRRGALAALESFGVDPSMTRSAALDAGLRVAGSAAVAGAANQARLNTEATGRALLGEAINIGRGYPGQVAQAYQTSQGAGQGAIGGTLAATNSGANTMGTAPAWAGVRSNTLGSWGGQVASMNNAVTGANSAQSIAQMNMMGNIVGTVGGAGTAAAIRWSDPSLKKGMKRVGHDSESGLGIWSFRYKEDPDSSPKVVGVNAAEVEKKFPAAVVLIPRKRGAPVRAVDYSKLPASVRRYLGVGAAA